MSEICSLSSPVRTAPSRRPLNSNDNQSTSFVLIENNTPTKLMSSYSGYESIGGYISLLMLFIRVSAMLPRR